MFLAPLRAARNLYDLVECRDLFHAWARAAVGQSACYMGLPENREYR